MNIREIERRVEALRLRHLERRKYIRQLMAKWFPENHLTAGETADMLTEDGGPGSGNFGHKGVPGQQGGSAPSASSTGANSPCKGFSSKAKLKDHAKRHGKALGCKDQNEYQKKGIDFLKQPCSGDVIGYATDDGKIVRFNTKTTEYASGYPGGKLCTYMKAKATRNGNANPETAMKYYLAFKKKDGVSDE